QNSEDLRCFRRPPLMMHFQTERTRMPRFLLVLSLLLGSIVSARPEPEKTVASPKWQASVVTLELARKPYDYTQPWSQKARRLRKTGVVYNDHEVLTTADQLFDRTLVRLQKNGRGRWWIGEVTWIDYEANLALVTTAETNFWSDLVPVKFGKGNLANRELQILRWRDSIL